MDFKLQVQEWKNILLRGSDQRDYQTYLTQFEQQEAKVAEELSRLAQLLAEVGDEVNQAQVGPIQEQMKTLGSRYREALASFRSDDRASAFAVDRQVRGIDREPTTRLDTLAENINHKAKEVLQEANASSQQLYASLRTALQVISGIAIVLTVVLAVIKSRA
jgi:CHASE3 domain sensor protein